MTSAKQRLPEIDLIRGLALLGVFLMNIDFMSTSELLASDWQANFSNPLDFITGKIKYVTLAQRFIGTFSLLFGLSIAIQQQNFKNSCVPFKAYYFKRTGVLFFIGVIHLLFFYMGDILIIYSVFSLLLLLFFRLSNRVLISSALLIFLIPAVLESLQLLPDFTSGIRQYYDAGTIRETYQSGTLLQMMKARITEYFFYDFTGISWNRTSFSMMILGYCIGRSNLHRTYSANWKKLKLALVISAILFVAFIVYFVLADIYFSFWLSILYNIHILISIITYVLLILFIYKSKIFSGVTSLIINVGKMSLSNYLFQSIICFFIFTSYGLGLFATTTPTYNNLIAGCVYIVQIVISYFYVRKFSAGPLELLWHKLAY